MSLQPTLPRSAAIRVDELSRHDGESDRWSLRFEHPNLERAGALPHPSSRSTERRTGGERRVQRSERPR